MYQYDVPFSNNVPSIFYYTHGKFYCLYNVYPLLILFYSSPTPILLIPPVKYLSTCCPIFIFAVFSPILPTPYFIIIHPLLHIHVYSLLHYFIHFFEYFPLFYLHPLYILSLHPTLFHFYFFGSLPNVTDGNVNGIPFLPTHHFFSIYAFFTSEPINL